MIRSFDGSVIVSYSDPHRAVVVDLVVDEEPAYKVVARVRCGKCCRWCVLGDKSFRAVARDGYSPLCKQCVPKAGPYQVTGFVEDQ